MQNIVILGAGFGGLKAAMQLAKKAKWLARRGYQIIVVDRNTYHAYTPTLYEVATTSKETANYLDLKKVTTYPITELIVGRKIVFRQGTVKNIDVR
ncbi:MAG: FAD-dependent oxidoreductase, partial [Candidatus Colwellbacteria bacterium]|nr:FAD-dependent oxidoreductase [Candidatus Colwellbacteria bacterium]